MNFALALTIGILLACNFSGTSGLAGAWSAFYYIGTASSFIVARKRTGGGEERVGRLRAGHAVLVLMAMGIHRYVGAALSVSVERNETSRGWPRPMLK